MNGKYFLDTNIIVYAFDSSNPAKQMKANELLVNALEYNKGCISFQVIQEFLNVATKKFIVPMSATDCETTLTVMLAPLCEVFTSIDLLRRALFIKERWQFSFYDALIVAAAIQAECKILYSEDLQANMQIYDVIVKNPFE